MSERVRVDIVNKQGKRVDSRMVERIYRVIVFKGKIYVWYDMQYWPGEVVDITDER